MCRGGIPPKIALPSSYVCSPPEIMRHYRPRGTVAFLPLKSTQPNPEVLGQVLPLDGASTLGAQCCDCDCHVCVGTGGNCPCLHHLEIHLAKYRGARQSVTRACLNLSCCTVAVVSHVYCLWLGSPWFLYRKNRNFLAVTAVSCM